MEFKISLFLKAHKKYIWQKTVGHTVHKYGSGKKKMLTPSCTRLGVLQLLLRVEQKNGLDFNETNTKVSKAKLALWSTMATSWYPMHFIFFVCVPLMGLCVCDAYQQAALMGNVLTLNGTFEALFTSAILLNGQCDFIEFFVLLWLWRIRHFRF